MIRIEIGVPQGSPVKKSLFYKIKDLDESIDKPIWGEPSKAKND